MSVVCDGAIHLRATYKFIQPTFLYSIGVARDEYPDSKLIGHRDAYKQTSHLDSRDGQKLRLRRGYAERGIVDSRQMFLCHRIRWLVQKVGECNISISYKLTGNRVRTEKRISLRALKADCFSTKMREITSSSKTSSSQMTTSLTIRRLIGMKTVRSMP